MAPFHAREHSADRPTGPLLSRASGRADRLPPHVEGARDQEFAAVNASYASPGFCTHHASPGFGEHAASVLLSSSRARLTP